MKNDLVKKIEELQNEVNRIKSDCKKSVFKKIFSKMSIIIGVVIAAITATLILHAAQIIFTSGSVISSSGVNNNFTELYTRVGNLENTNSGAVIKSTVLLTGTLTGCNSNGCLMNINYPTGYTPSNTLVLSTSIRGITGAVYDGCENSCHFIWLRPSYISLYSGPSNANSEYKILLGRIN